MRLVQLASAAALASALTASLASALDPARDLQSQLEERDARMAEYWKKAALARRAERALKKKKSEEDDGDADSKQSKKKKSKLGNDFLPEFEWAKHKGDDADFYGELEFCGGTPTKTYWNTYQTNYAYGLASNETFGYRQYGTDGPCDLTSPAPIITVQPGKTYKLILINNSNGPTNLHTHGPHIDGNGMGDDVLRTSAPGECLVYYWNILPDHMAGTHWYHPHEHHYAFEHLRGGAFGMFVIEEPKKMLKSYPKSVQKWLKNTIYMQVSTNQVPSPLFGLGTKCIGTTDDECKDGVGDVETCSPDVCHPYINGKAMETVNVISGEWYRFSMLGVVPNGHGEDVIKFFDAEDEDAEVPCTIMIASIDGVYRAKVPRDIYPLDYFHLGPANRLDLAVRCTGNAIARYALEHPDGNGWDYHIKEQLEDGSLAAPIIMEIKVQDGKVSKASPWADEENGIHWYPPYPDYMPTEFLLEQDSSSPVEVEEVKPEMVKPPIPPKWVINGLEFDADVPLFTPTFNTIQEWHLKNTAGEPAGHPMHNHVNHAMVVGAYPAGTKEEEKENFPFDQLVDCGVNFQKGGWYDSIRIAKDVVDGNVTDHCITRFVTADFSGKIILHCHALLHEDWNMMGWANVQGGPENEAPGPAVMCANVLADGGSKSKSKSKMLR